ncbi:hypothetical protein ALO94_200093 [Pseudomonas syringae pv. spinaceae]|uniref:Uncharacterized protein n=1 Tax=Pseudomonas syringae pv. spinaceae TaxID=264459 RepID=A0A0Q0BKD3_PSESX|nr:hypothetical protein ALO94_200093 [Pseudomonas syringae pv. spinaceae]
MQRFGLHLEHVDGPETVIPVGLLSAERDPSMLFELARGRLEQVLVASPVRAVRLQARDLPDFVPAHRELFDERVQQTLPWEQLRERLRARLGDESVNGLRPPPRMCLAAAKHPQTGPAGARLYAPWLVAARAAAVAGSRDAHSRRP